MEIAATLAVLFVCFTLAIADDHSNGWGDNIDWKPFDEGAQDAIIDKRMMMLIIHKSWCGACKALKPKFQVSKEIQDLSNHFVMVNTLDDQEPKDDMYSPEGASYIPRVLFIHDGEVKMDLFHEGGNEKYKYYYHSPDGIALTMKRAIEKYNLKPRQVKSDEL